VSRRAQLSWTSPDTPQSSVFLRVDGRWRGTCWVTGERASLDGCHLARSTDSSLAFWFRRLSSFLLYRLLVLLTRVVVGNLHTNLAGVLALAIEAKPFVTLSSTRRDDGTEIRKGLAN
jgi:ABC-type methionine transport system permease subunit